MLIFPMWGIIIDKAQDDTAKVIISCWKLVNKSKINSLYIAYKKTSDQV